MRLGRFEALDDRLAPLPRELARAAAAVALYLMCYPLWMRSGLHEAYGNLVYEATQYVVRRFQHFSVIYGVARSPTLDFDFVTVLAVCLCVVSTKLAVVTRLKLAVSVVAALFVVQVTTFVLKVHVAAADDLLARRGLFVLLPWEHWILERSYYFFHHLGRQSGQFLLMIFFAACNSGLLWRARLGDAKRLGSRRKPVMLLCAPVIAVVLGGYAWGWLREHDPRHIEAHAQIAQLAVAAGESEIAEEQHRLAMAEGWNAQEGSGMR